ncbi:MAG: PAS domain S-box protein, partial [Polaromonas sp.]
MRPSSIDSLALSLSPGGSNPGGAAALLAGVLESAMDAIITVDEQQRIVMYNRAAEEVFGWSRQEVLLQPLEKLIPDRFRPNHARHVESYSGTGVSSRRMGVRRVIHGLRRNGEEFPLDASISVLHTPEGKLFTAIVRDITELDRLQREQADNDARLRESQRRLQA